MKKIGLIATLLFGLFIADTVYAACVTKCTCVYWRDGVCTQTACTTYCN